MATIARQGNAAATISDLSGPEQTYIDSLPLPEDVPAGKTEAWAEELGDSGSYRVPICVADYLDRLANPAVPGTPDPRDQHIQDS